MNRLWVLVLAAVLLSGCRQEKFKPIPQEEFARIVADVELLEATLRLDADLLKNDTDNVKLQGLYDSLFAFYGISKQVFDKNMEWYYLNLDKVTDLNNAVIRILEQGRDSINQLPDSVFAGESLADSLKLRRDSIRGPARNERIQPDLQ